MEKYALSPLTHRLAYRPAEAARLLGVGRSTLYRIVAQGALPLRRIGGCSLIPADDLHALVATRAEKASTGAVDAAGASGG